MADRKISDLTALTTPASGDYLPIVDISEASAANKNKRITIEELLRGAPDGTAGAPGIAFESDPNTGIYSPGADQVAISTNGTGRLFIDASGNVGVGGSPVNRFDVFGSSSISLGITATSNFAGLQVTAANNSFSFINLGDSDDANIGQIAYHHTDDSLRFTTNNSERMRLDSSGRVGLGTSSPGSVLEVKDNSQGPNTWTSLSDCVTDASFRFKGSNHVNGYGAYMGYANSSNDAFGIQSANAAGASPYPILLNPFGGSVGIGTTSPANTLHVKGGNANTLLLDNGGEQYTLIDWHNNTVIRAQTYYDNTNHKFEHYVPTTNSAVFAWKQGTTERARIDSSGRLLVGTSTSVTASALQLVQNVANGGGQYIAGNSATSLAQGGSVGYLRFYSNAGGVWNDGARIAAIADAAHSSTSVATRLEFSTTADGASSPTERMRITNKGKMDLCSAATSNAFNCVTQEAAGTTYYLIYGGHTSSGLGNFGTQSFGVWSNGNVINTNNSYGAISDIKLKENIVDAGSQWDDLKDLRVVNYNFKEGQTHTQIGLIAQEVELVSPGLVSESPDRDEEGNDLGTVTKSVNYSVLYMKAVKALQEAMERIEVLEAKVNALEGN